MRVHCPRTAKPEQATSGKGIPRRVRSDEPSAPISTPIQYKVTHTQPFSGRGAPRLAAREQAHSRAARRRSLTRDHPAPRKHQHRHAQANQAQHTLADIAPLSRKNLLSRSFFTHIARISFVRMKVFALMGMRRATRLDLTSRESANAPRMLRGCMALDHADPAAASRRSWRPRRLTWPVAP
jgi:hypothetical protein